MRIEPGFWNCCQAKPTKIVAFDDDRAGAVKGALVWHYACAGCASTVHPSRVQDAPAKPDIRVVTIQFDDGAKADEFRRELARQGYGYIRWDQYMDDAYAMVWLPEKERE